jgi:hypothetical protein
MVLPVAGPDGTPPVIIKTHAKLAFKSVSWSAMKSGRPPRIPCPEPADGNEVLLSSVLSPATPKLQTNGLSHIWSIAGTYTYVLMNPLAPCSKGLPSGGDRGTRRQRPTTFTRPTSSGTICSRARAVSPNEGYDSSQTVVEVTIGAFLFGGDAMAQIEAALAEANLELRRLIAACADMASVCDVLTSHHPSMLPSDSARVQVLVDTLANVAAAASEATQRVREVRAEESIDPVLGIRGYHPPTPVCIRDARGELSLAACAVERLHGLLTAVEKEPTAVQVKVLSGEDTKHLAAGACVKALLTAWAHDLNRKMEEAGMRPADDHQEQ